MTNSWMNEDGEPIMDGAAWRFEQQLDIDSRDDYYADRFYDEDDEPDGCEPHNDYCEIDDPDECPNCRGYWLDFHAEGMMEDQHLDGTYEE